MTKNAEISIAAKSPRSPSPSSSRSSSSFFFERSKKLFLSGFNENTVLVFFYLRSAETGGFDLHLRHLEEIVSVLVDLALEEVAGNVMSLVDLYERRGHALTLIARHEATGVELTALRGMDRAGDVTLEDDPLLVDAVGVGGGDGREQSHGIGMSRISEESVGIAELNDVTEVHNAYSIRDISYDGEVVRYEEIGEILLFLELLEQVDDLRLDRHVESGYALVTYDELWVHREGTRDTNSLSLSA